MNDAAMAMTVLRAGAATVMNDNGSRSVNIENQRYKDFDKLIAESFERDRMLESINRSVMKEINRTERKTLLHCVLKLVGMAFGIPLVGISGVSAIISGMEKAGSDIVLAALVLSLIVFALSALMMLMKFSSESFVIISRAACHKDELKNINN